jgi:arylsulfatase A-like enzyme
VASPSAAGLWFPWPPKPREITLDGERRAAVLTTVDPWRWTGRAPPGSELHAGVQVLPEVWGTIRGFRAWVTARSGEEREVLDVVATHAGEPARWLDFTADLSRWAGRKVTLEFAATLEGLPARYRHANVVAWGPVRISAHAQHSRPNILFILVDTLRRDHLTPYGYPRDTSPNIARLLAQRGAVVEEAYSQAPWTLPSVASFLASRHPGEILGDDPNAYGLPGDVPSLPAALRGRGYETGGFIANQVLHAGNGFGRGFDTFYSPLPGAPGGLNQPGGAELTARVLPWLEGHRNTPFFLYVHYIDPHDPYANPEIVAGRSPFFPEYRGRITGLDVQGVYAGKIPLDDPQQDREQLVALYDSEIHYVDRAIGRLLDAIPRDVLANTLVVLTADHGEEFLDHGGWKHGFTLYEDQIHVPLLLRWDGRIPAGSRLAGVVRLLDVAPTLLRAAGGAVPTSWQGIDLMPALTRRSPLPRLTAFAQHMTTGPLRAAAVLGRRKLILFNPRTPYTPADPLQAYLWTKDLARLHRIELYDLSRDAGERSNLAAATSDEVDQLQPLIHRQLDRQLPGLRVIASGLPAGSRLQGSLVLDRPPSRWRSYFLAADDRVEMRGNRVSFDLGGETLAKGFLLDGEISSVQAVEVRLDGRSLPESAVLVGRGTAELSARSGPLLRVWFPGSRRPASGSSNPETERRLRALGYVQ